MAEDERCSEGDRSFEERRAKIWRLLEELTGRPHVALDVAPVSDPDWELGFTVTLDDDFILPGSGETFSLPPMVALEDDKKFEAMLESDGPTPYVVEYLLREPHTDDTIDWAAPEALAQVPLFLSPCFKNPAVAAAAEKQRRADPEWMTWLFEQAFPEAILAALDAAWTPQPVRLGPEWLHEARWKQLEPGGPLVPVPGERAKVEPIRLLRSHYRQWLRAEVYARVGQAILERGRKVLFDDAELTPAEAADVAWSSIGEPSGQVVALTNAERILQEGILCGLSADEVARRQKWKPKTLAFHRRNLLRKLAAR